MTLQAEPKMEAKVMTKQTQDEKPVVRLSGKTGRPVELRYKNGKSQYKCDRCGKWLNSEESIAAEEGHYCEQLYAKYTPEDLQAIRKARTRQTVPTTDGVAWVKTKLVHKACDKHGIPVSRLVRAFGGDRGTLPVLDARFEFVYVGKARYVDPWCLSKDGLTFLKNVQTEPVIPLKDAPTKSTKQSKQLKSVKSKVPMSEVPASALEEVFAEIA